MSPTARTLKELRRLGAVADVVERWISGAMVRRDLFGFIDIVALWHGRIVGIQCTSAANHAARRRKICSLPTTEEWLCCGGRILIWSWGKKGDRGKRKTWKYRIESIISAS